jgi:hypothetical protein
MAFLLYMPRRPQLFYPPFYPNLFRVAALVAPVSLGARLVGKLWTVPLDVKLADIEPGLRGPALGAESKPKRRRAKT